MAADTGAAPGADQPAPGRSAISTGQHRGERAQTWSEQLRCSSAFALVQHELPRSARLEARPYHLIIASSSGPGDVTYRIGRRVISRHIRARGLFFLPAGHACDVTLHSPLMSIQVHLDAGLFRDPEGSARNFGSGLAPIFGQDDDVLQSLLLVMEELVRGDRAGSALQIADLIALAMAHRLIAINHDLSKLSGPAAGGRQLSGGHLRKVRDYVEANLATGMKLEELADLCGVGVPHFIRLFKSTTGVSPYQYVLGLRVGRAKALLGDRSLTLVDVAGHCGFANQQHLIRTFRRVTGITPGAYRRG